MFQMRNSVTVLSILRTHRCSNVKFNHIVFLFYAMSYYLIKCRVEFLFSQLSLFLQWKRRHGGTSRVLLFAPNDFFIGRIKKKKKPTRPPTSKFSRNFARVLNKVGNIFPYIVYLFASPPPLHRRLLQAIKTNHHGIFFFFFTQLRIENT